MSKKLKPVVWALVLVITLSSFAGIKTAYAAPVKANIVINNRPYLPQNSIENINDRMLLPFREISEAIGATVDWEGSSRRILTTYGSKYSIMFIDNPIVTYGTYTVDSAGVMQFSTTNTAVMDVMPQLVGNFTYIPLRTFIETLGAEVNWIAQTSTAYITVPSADTAGQTPEESPQPSPSPSDSQKAANYNDFTNTSYFRIIASDAVKSMYQDIVNRSPFVFVLYDSTKESSKTIVPNLQDVAQSVAYRIYGVDMADTDNKDKDNEWLWSFFRENNFKDPTVYFVYSKNKVEEVAAPTDMADMKTRILRFSAQAETDYDYGDFSDTTYFKNRSDVYIGEQTADGKEFILVLYDSTDEDSKYYIPFIKAAAKEKQTLVLALDIDKYPRYHRNADFLEENRPDATGSLPMMFLVYTDMDDLQIYKKPPTVDQAKSYIDEFLKYESSGSSGAAYSDIASKTYYTNASINTVRSKYDNATDDFVLFIYDSSDSTYKVMVEDFIYYADRNKSLEKNFLYGVNKNSSTYNANKDLDSYGWLRISSSSLKSSRPIICFITNGSVTYQPVSNLDSALDFLENHLNP